MLNSFDTAVLAALTEQDAAPKHVARGQFSTFGAMFYI